MSALSNYSEKLILDWLMTNGSATRPTSWYVALYTAAPSDSGGGTEVSSGGYTRQSITFGAAATPGGTTSNTDVVNFTASGASFGIVTHLGIFDAASGGNLLWHGQLSVAIEVLDGDALEFGIGNLILTLD
jgi:hypothetical protein